MRHAHLGLILDDHDSDPSGLRELGFSFIRSDFGRVIGDWTKCRQLAANCQNHVPARLKSINGEANQLGKR